MNILLINPPIRLNAPPYIHPIGLMIVASSLRNAGHNVKILDYNTIRSENIKDQLPDGNWGWVGISGLISTYGFLRKLVPLVREKYPGVPLVLGGGGFTSAPEVYMEEFRPEYGVIGEGEHTAVQLTDQIEFRTDEKILGLYGNEPRPLERRLDSFPLPAFDLVDMDTYLNNVKYAKAFGRKREAAFFATRGCPFGCKYCYHIFGRGIRYRTIDHIMRELDILVKQYGVDSLLVPDECLTANKRYIQELCREIIKRGFDLKWKCYSRADTVDEQTLQLMKEAGCFGIGFGLESGSQRILDLMGKGIKLEEVAESIKLARKIGIDVGTTAIFGYPGETDESIVETLNFCAEERVFPTLFYLQPYPGTDIYEQNKEKIKTAFPNLGDYFSELGDAGLPVVNLTNWSLEEVYNRYVSASNVIHKLAERAKC